MRLLSPPRFLLTTGAIVGLAALSALGHDFWLELPSFRLAPGATASLRLLLGVNFQGQPWVRPSRKIQRLVRYGAGADSADLTTTDTLGRTVTFARTGTHLLVLGSRNAFSELPAAEFTAYLRAEGLDNALRQRQENGQSGQPGREAYRRCAKLLVQVGPAAANDTTFRRVCRLPLELVPEQNPYRLRPGQALTVRVLRAGKPAAGLLVWGWERRPGGAAPQNFQLRTNQSGRCLLRLSGAGPYLLTTVDMVPAPSDLPAADWLSSWASLTFGGPLADK